MNEVRPLLRGEQPEERLIDRAESSLLWQRRQAFMTKKSFRERSFIIKLYNLDRYSYDRNCQ